MKKLSYILPLLLAISASGQPSGGLTSAQRAKLNAAVTNITAVYSVTNYGYIISDAGTAAANGVYWLRDTNYYGQIGSAIWTNSADTNYTLTVGTFSAGGFSEVRSGTDVLYETAEHAVIGATWYENTGDAPVPSFASTNRVAYFTNTYPSSGTYRTTNIVWIDLSGNDDSAFAIGRGQFQQFPFKTIEAGFNSANGKTVRIGGGLFVPKVSAGISNAVVLAEGSALNISALGVTTVPIHIAGNIEWYGGTITNGDWGEQGWRSENITSLRVKGVRWLYENQMFVNYIYTNLTEVVFEDCELISPSYITMSWLGNAGTNLFLRFNNCTFSKEEVSGANIGNPAAKVVALQFQNCRAEVLNSHFKFANNPMVNTATSAFIEVGTNAFVTLGGNSYDLKATNGVVSTNIIYMSTNSAICPRVRYLIKD